MKNLIGTAVFLLVVSSVGSVFAAQNNSGIYLGAKGGLQNISILKGDIGTSTSNTKKFMVNLNAGYLYALSNRFEIGAQIGYSYYGKFVANTGGAELANSMSSLNLQAVGQINMQQWFIQARAGMARFIAFNSKNDTATLQYGLKNSWKALAGLSVGYHFTGHVSADFFYDHLFGREIKNADFTSVDRGVPTIDSVGLGVSYTF